MNPLVIEQDGSRWYEASGVDAYIAELEGDCTDWRMGAEKYQRRSQADYRLLREACRALSQESREYVGLPVSGVIALLRYKLAPQRLSEKRVMRTFTMYRHDIPEGTHDENQKNAHDEPQFQGVEFDDGTVAIRWMTAKASTSLWFSMEDMLAVHGHPEYGSELVWDVEAVQAEVALVERDEVLRHIVHLLENSRAYEAMIYARLEGGSG